MGEETFTVLALPHSKSPNADIHVSLFISPRLIPEAGEGELSEFPNFVRWAELLDGDEGDIELFDQNGPIPADPILSAIDPSAFTAVFPDTTPVRAPEPPDFSDRHWRTFPVAPLHDMSVLLHHFGIFLSPVSLPPASRHPLTNFIASFGGEARPGTSLTHLPAEGEYNEQRITELLDRIVGEGRELLTLRDIEANISQLEHPFLQILAQYHRARRFYERPEAQSEYAESPDPDATIERPPRPEPDFHEQWVFVGDHPTVQRRLGQVIDVKVLDLARLADSEWISARIMVPGSPPLIGATTRTTCKAVGDDLVTVASSSDWVDGALRLSDTDRFAVLDTDPDGAILKAERYMLGLPRLRKAERNGEPVHAAPTALRSTGFTITHSDQGMLLIGRLETQQQIQHQIAASNPPLLFTEDVTQGYRVEVWDETTGRWYSLHDVRIDARAFDDGDEVGQVALDEPEVGFVEGGAVSETVDVEDSPVHVHEALFGWDGWSLSAEKPGSRIRHEDGEEIVEPADQDPDPVTRLVIRSEVAPGTLPRLRYGRSYAFRVWATDLAGNSRPHEVGPPGPVDDGTVSMIASEVARRPRPGLRIEPLEAVMRPELAATVVRSRREAAKPEEADLPRVFRRSGIFDPVLRHLVEVRADRLETAVTSDRADLVSRAFSDLILVEDEPLIVDTARFDPDLISRAVGPIADVELVPRVVEQVSPIRPFLRWDPIPPPVIVPRRRYTEGESLRQVVVRSGVTQDPDTLEIAVIPPDDYAAQTSAHDYHATSERHLAPPKTSQGAAETYGAFDDAIGSIDPEEHKRMYAAALRESGTLFDTEVRSLDDPHTFELQAGIDIATDPGVDESEKITLPIDPGEMPPAGQYVVHDTDELRLPYLPDVAGRGVSLVFPEAGRDRHIAFPFGTEGFTAAYKGTWPELLPFRLILAGSDELYGALRDTKLTIGLPPGDVQRFRLSSSMGEADLEKFAMWRLLNPTLAANPEVMEAAKDGWLWALTPFDEVTLVHAVPRPIEAPRPTILDSERARDSTDVVLVGAVDIDGQSTESLTLEAHWTDTIDDVTLPRPEERQERGIAFTTPVHEEEDIALLHGDPDEERVVPGVGSVWVHEAVHKLGDTRHHTINYRFRATTRFSEYFAPELLAGAGSADPDDPSAVFDDGTSVVGPERVVNVANSAVPSPPRVHSVIPLFRWDHGTEPEQPAAVRRRRRPGLRVYLERPWFTSGNGELLGVLLAPDARAEESLQGKSISGWGGDPVWKGRDVAFRGELHLDNLLRAEGLDDRPGDATPVSGPVVLPLPVRRDSDVPSFARGSRVVVLGYRPQFSEARDMWYVDIAVDPLDTMWPFVQLAVARYQPDSIPGCHLSAPVLTDFTLLTPERTASVSRTDVRHVRVVVSGPVGWRSARGSDSTDRVDAMDQRVSPNRQLVARLQKRDRQIPTDLGWETVDTVELKIRGRGLTEFEAAWVGTLEANRDIPLRRPGRNRNWRVTIEEWEMLPGDPPNLSRAGRLLPPIWERRLVYADEVAL